MTETPSDATASEEPEAVAEAEVADIIEEVLVADEIELDARAQELTDDLQRVIAEYANYRKRVDRDRGAVGELAVVSVLSEMLPLLDDIERAREHNELSGAFKSVGEGLEALATKLGLETFGVEGDLFDPMQHEAMTHSEASEDADPRAVEGPIVGQVFTPGYRYKGRIVRAARVGVVE